MNKMICEPGTENYTHHITLEDAEGKKVGLIAVNSQMNASIQGISRQSVPRTAQKNSTGATKYTDMEPPWSPIAQDNFAGGRGMNDFDKDITRYKDSYKVNTLHGEIYLAPQEEYSTGYRNAIANLSKSVTWVSMLPGGRKYIAVQITPEATFDAATIMLQIRRRGTPASNLTVELCDQVTGEPGNVLQTFDITTNDITDIVSRYWRETITAETLTLTDYYWLKVYTGDADDENCWQVACTKDSANTYQSANGTTWTASTIDLLFRITDADDGCTGTLFQYKNAQYMLRQPASGAPKLYKNGDRGVADANTGALNTLVDASKSWTPGEWTGCTVEITAGKGMDEDINYRTITYNLAGSLTVTPDWKIEHDITTEYVIKGSLKWTEISAATHLLTAKVTCVFIVNNICYFCQGDATNIIRHREYNNAGTWTDTDYAADGTNKATSLCTVRDSTNGLEIWRSNNSDGSAAISVSKAAVVAWGTALTFGAPTNTTYQDDLGRITNIVEYGDSSKNLWMMREGSIFNLVGGKPDEIELKEIRSLMDSSNGKVVFKNNVYLFFNLGIRLERYYDRNVDDYGANRDDGLPVNRLGTISAAISLPGMIAYSIKGNPAAFSTIMGNNLSFAPGAGYCELYRTPMEGDAIHDMQYQVIKGSAMDGIWVMQNDDAVWIPYTIDKPNNTTGWKYAPEGMIEQGYMYAGMYDIYKLAHSYKILSEELSTGQTVEVDYRVDQETEWKTITGIFEESPSQELQIGEFLAIQGKRIQTRMRINTDDNTKSPKIVGTVLEAIARVPIKFAYTFSYRLTDNDHDLNGNKDEYTAEEKQDILDEWAEQLTPLKMRCIRKRFDNKTVFIDPSPMTAMGTKSERYLANISITGL